MTHAKLTYLVLGLGHSGLSCVRFLRARGVQVIVNDSRSSPPDLAQFRQNYPDVPIQLGSFDANLIEQADIIIASPGIDLRLPIFNRARQKNIPIWGDIELFAQHAIAPVIAITGSNAKGTVTTLIAQMAAQAGLTVRVGGNIGTPALDLLQTTEPDLYVLELSSFQLETTYSLKLAAAAYLNLSPDHLDRYADMAAYSVAKQRIFQHCAVTVFNQDDPQTWPVNPVPQQISFSIQTPTQHAFGIQESAGISWLAYGNELWLPTNALKIKGRHNWLNALAACALGLALGLPKTAMLETLKLFPGLPHRCQWVAEIAGVNWYNDSKGTNIGATLAAIEGLAHATTERNLILLAGGLGKGADFTSLRAAVSKHVKSVILFGQDALLLQQALQDTTAIFLVNNLAEAVQLAHVQAKNTDNVLLSPACASYDQFQGFEQRGEMFTQYVQELMR